MAIQKIGVIGAGTMGNGIAHVFARSGFDVVLCDVEQRFLDRGLDTIAKNLDREIAKNKISAGASKADHEWQFRLSSVEDKLAYRRDHRLLRWRAAGELRKIPSGRPTRQSAEVHAGHSEISRRPPSSRDLEVHTFRV